MQQAPTRYRFSVDDYYRMAESGILRADDRVELVDGEVVRMSPIGVKHAAAVNKLNRLFIRRLGERAYVSTQNPVRLSPHTELQPALMLLVPGDERYERSHPGPADVLLLIEASDSSLAYDRDVKLSLYAAAGIAEVWIIDLQGKQLLAYTTPQRDGYATQHMAPWQETIAPAAFPDLLLAMADLLG